MSSVGSITLPKVRPWCESTCYPNSPTFDFDHDHIFLCWPSPVTSRRANHWAMTTWSLFFVSAFVGFPSDDEGGVFRNHILPAFLIGWNTFAFRLFFGMLLPLLMVKFMYTQPPIFNILVLTQICLKLSKFSLRELNSY